MVSVPVILLFLIGWLLLVIDGKRRRAEERAAESERAIRDLQQWLIGYMSREGISAGIIKQIQFPEG